MVVSEVPYHPRVREMAFPAAPALQQAILANYERLPI